MVYVLVLIYSPILYIVALVVTKLYESISGRYFNKKKRETVTRISGVSERDIDLLLLEEFISSTDFQELFLKESKFKDMKLTFASAQKSVTDTTGESDLEINFRDSNNDIFLLMIENKVNASFQKDQLQRYVRRVFGYPYDMILAFPNTMFQGLLYNIHSVTSFFFEL